MISLTHFKGHEGTGFGGALKNLGMGCGSSAGKAEMHETEKPAVNRAACVGCGVCARNCAHDAIHVVEKKVNIDYAKCKGCGRCIGVCPTKAMRPGQEKGCEMLSRRVAEYAYAVVKDKPSFHISLAIDISPFCDCYGSNDAPILPDVGMFASFDPVALDQACVDLCNREKPFADSLLGEKRPVPGVDFFHALHPDTNWEAGIEQAEKIGLGSKADYISGNTDRVRSELIAAAESKELDALKKTKKAELKAEGITDSKAVDKALNEVAVSAEKKNEIASSITDDAVAAEVEKQYADYIANMLGEKKDGALNAKLNANKALAAEGAKAAAEAMDKAEAAAKEGEKTYQKKAEKAASDSEKELAKLQKTALELLPETVFEELANDYQAAEVAALQYEAYDNTSSEKAMMETEGKAKYNEKKSTLSLTFANGQKIDTNFGASFGYNEIKHLSILGYVGFPYEVEDFSEEMTYRIENFYINDVVLIPIILLVLCIIGIVMCALKKDKLSAGIVPAILGVVGVIGYLTSDFLKLGDKYTVHIILFAVIFAVAVLHIVLSAKKAKKA